MPKLNISARRLYSFEDKTSCCFQHDPCQRQSTTRQRPAREGQRSASAPPWSENRRQGVLKMVFRLQDERRIGHPAAPLVSCVEHSRLAVRAWMKQAPEHGCSRCISRPPNTDACQVLAEPTPMVLRGHGCDVDPCCHSCDGDDPGLGWMESLRTRARRRGFLSPATHRTACGLRPLFRAAEAPHGRPTIVKNRM